MNYVLSMERYPGTSEVCGGLHLGSNERLAREIAEEKMKVCRDNDWPMVTMAIILNGKVFDTLYRDGKWHNAVERSQWRL